MSCEWKYGPVSGGPSICFNTPTPVSNIPIWLFPKTEADLNIMELKDKWEESEKGYMASQYIKS